MVRSLLLIVSLPFAAFSALGCGQAQAPAAEVAAVAPPEAKLAPLATPAALVGSALPALSLLGTEGETSQLKVVDAKPTVVLLWSTWCQACLHETKELNQWVKTRDDVRVLAVNVNGINGEQPEVAKVRASAAELGLSGPIWIAGADNLSSLGVRTCPTTFIVDAKGMVRAANVGYKGADEMGHWLDSNLQTL